VRLISLQAGGEHVDDAHVPEVLIVDDDPDVRGLLVFTLADAGFEVREAQDGAHALDALRERAPDCMLLDLMMPGLDGFGVLEAMRAQGLAPKTRVVILTCKTEEASLVRGWELGADEYLTKPTDPLLLTLKVAELVEQAPTATG
jgi:DNA-binding response OmpR family regulator